MEPDIKQIATHPFPRSFYRGVNRYFKAAMTKDFIYYFAYAEGDDSGNVVMFRIKNGRLVSDNYFAADDLFGNILDGKLTWTSKTMAKNVKHVLAQAND